MIGRTIAVVGVGIAVVVAMYLWGRSMDKKTPDDANGK